MQVDTELGNFLTIREKRPCVQVEKLFLFYTYRLNKSIADLKSKMDQQNQEYARLTVAKGVELETLHQQETKMRSEYWHRGRMI